MVRAVPSAGLCSLPQAPACAPLPHPPCPHTRPGPDTRSTRQTSSGCVSRRSRPWSSCSRPQHRCDIPVPLPRSSVRCDSHPPSGEQEPSPAHPPARGGGGGGGGGPHSYRYSSAGVAAPATPAGDNRATRFPPHAGRTASAFPPPAHYPGEGHSPKDKEDFILPRPSHGRTASMAASANGPHPDQVCAVAPPSSDSRPLGVTSPRRSLTLARPPAPAGA